MGYDICPGWGSMCDSPEEVVGSWSPNEWIRLRMLLDREEERFYIWVNGTLHEGAFEPDDGNLYTCDWLTIYSDELLSYTDDVRVFFLENRS